MSCHKFGKCMWQVFGSQPKFITITLFKEEVSLPLEVITPEFRHFSLQHGGKECK